MSYQNMSTMPNPLITNDSMPEQQQYTPEQQQYMPEQQQYMPEQQYIHYPHPYLNSTILYISDLDAQVTEEDMALALTECRPFRPRFVRDVNGGPGIGTLDFKTIHIAEKTLAILNNRPIGNHPTPLSLSPYPPSDPPMYLPLASATPRLAKYLPSTMTDGQLFELFRPYGPIATARMQGEFGRDTGLVQYWNEEDAVRAQEALHMAMIGDRNIAVEPVRQRRGPPHAFSATAPHSFSPTAPPFVPRGGGSRGRGRGGGGRGRPVSQHSGGYESPPPVFVHGPGQQVQLAPPSGPGSSSASGLIDPCNLFVKNLDMDVDSNALFQHFRQFGHIVSARIMRDEAGNSKGFGFVSYQTPEQADLAMRTMHGVMLGSKQMHVRLHEPRALRQEKLRERFAREQGASPVISGATSPSPSDSGASLAGAAVGTRERRGSGSYFQAALAGNIVLQADELSSLSPVVRREVLTGELNRRIREMPDMPDGDVDNIIDFILNLPLTEIVSGLTNPAKFEIQVSQARGGSPFVQEPQAGGDSAVSLEEPEAEEKEEQKESGQTEIQEMKEQGQHLAPAMPGEPLAPVPRGLSASAPQQPTEPHPGADDPAVLSPHRTTSPVGSVPTTTAPPASSTEREKLRASVLVLEPQHAEEITEMLITLSKKERMLCLFNQEYLKTKVADAKQVVELLADAPENEQSTNGRAPTEAQPQPQLELKVQPHTPAPKPRTSIESSFASVTPDLSSRGPSAAASPSSLPATPTVSTARSAVPAEPYTLATLSALPAVEIIRLVSYPSSSTGLPLPKADPAIIKSTDEWLDGLVDLPMHMQKQKVGEKLHKMIRSMGSKNAAKLAVNLLDHEDLRSLAHLMNSYPTVLKEKVAQTVLSK